MEKKEILNKLKTTGKGLTKAQKQKWLAGLISVVVLATVGVGTGVGVHLHRQAQIPIQALSETETDSVSETSEGIQPTDTIALDSESASVGETSAESTTGKMNKSAAAAASDSSGSESKKNTEKVTYVHDGVPLRIQGQQVLFPQNAYICVSEFSDYMAAANTFTVSKYKPYAYFDSSVPNPNIKNKAIELQKDYYWTNQTLKKYNITVPSYVSVAPPDSWSQNKKMAKYSLEDDVQANRAIIKAFLDKGLITSSQKEQDRLVRKNCSARSYVCFSFPKDMPQDILQRDIAYAKELFGTEGVTSYTELERVQKLLFARADEVCVQTGLNVRYVAEYCPNNSLA